MNRNVITPLDITNLLDPSKGTPKTLDTAPPAGDVTPGGAAGGVTVPTADDYLTKLLKYVPLEVLGAYLFVESLVNANVSDRDELQVWLFCVLAAALVLSAAYARTVLNVVRSTQIIMGAVGLGVYVFSTGGWFATMGWYEEWFTGIALVLYAILVAMIKLPQLPTE